jgi:hypothetical protein
MLTIIVSISFLSFYSPFYIFLFPIFAFCEFEWMYVRACVRARLMDIKVSLLTEEISEILLFWYEEKQSLQKSIIERKRANPKAIVTLVVGGCPAYATRIKDKHLNTNLSLIRILVHNRCTWPQTNIITKSWNVSKLTRLCLKVKVNLVSREKQKNITIFYMQLKRQHN